MQERQSKPNANKQKNECNIQYNIVNYYLSSDKDKYLLPFKKGMKTDQKIKERDKKQIKVVKYSILLAF